MIIAIHPSKGGFSDRWIAYCEQNHINYKIVNAYSNDVLHQIAGCDYFMWHFHQGDYRDMQMAKALILSLETKGVKCFPNSNTCWHFDNKVWQKYLLEAVGAPLVPSYVFYTKKEAMDWVKTTDFPKVFKLKGGAGSSNVKLAHSRMEAEHFIKLCFGKGFSQYRCWDQLKEEWRKYKDGRSGIRNVLRPLFYAFKRYKTEFSHYHQKEIGYAYFQDFVPNNKFDIRVCVVDNKAFALKRLSRANDFRASGSGIILYEKSQIDERCVRIAFRYSSILKAQSIAYDFVFDQANNPLIVEISYGYAIKAYDHCVGYWTEDMSWHEGTGFDVCGWMIENLIR